MDNLPVYMLILSMVLYLVYTKVSKFLGSIGVLLLGIGLMYRVGDDGWIGLIVMICGLMMIVANMISKPSSRRK